MTIDDLVIKLQAAHAARKDPLDLPRTFTQRQIDAYVAETTRMASSLSVLRNIDNDLRQPLALIADLEAKRAMSASKQAELEAAIASSPDWRLAGDTPRARDAEFERQHQLKMQLRLLHENRLLFAPGQVYWNVADLDVRIAELNAKIAQHRERHEAHVEQAEALLADAVSA